MVKCKKTPNHKGEIDMEQTKYSTNSSHKKGAHLKFEEKVIIQTRWVVITQNFQRNRLCRKYSEKRNKTWQGIEIQRKSRALQR